MLTGARGDVAIKIFGDDAEELNQVAKEMVAMVKTIPGAEDVNTQMNEGLRYLQLKVNRDMAGRLGLTVDQVEDSFPAWSPDSRLLMWSRHGELVVARTDGSGMVDIGPGNFPSWIP